MILDELTAKLLGERSKYFVYEYIADDKGRDVYEIDCYDGKVVLRGNNNISIAMALRKYIDKYLNGDISWWGYRIDKGIIMPEYERYVVEQKLRAYMNYCTFSYSCAWWDYERWEKEIDMMALYGINMPLAVVGMEMVLYNVLERMGYDEYDILKCISAPTHIAWQLMGNIDGYNSPHSKSEVVRRYELGKKIIDRMREYGMTPIMQGFSGVVPRLLEDRYGSDITICKEWCSFKGTAMLDPASESFREYGRMWLEEEEKLFGRHHYYAADPFHEGEPIHNTKQYLNAVGKSVFDMFMSYDDSIEWVMQGWTPYENIVKAVPRDKLIILDLTGNMNIKYRRFWGYRFVVGNLHNFGGRINLHGDMRLIASNRFMKYKKKGYNVIGTGLFMEGIEQNPMYYSLAFEMLTNNDKVNVDYWVTRYPRRRYGIDSDNLKMAATLLLDSAYKKGTNNVESSSIICARPSIKTKKSGPNAGFALKYDRKVLEDAANFMALESRRLAGLYQYRFDFADIVRQVMSNNSEIVLNKVLKYYKARRINKFNGKSNEFLTLLKDMDEMLFPLRELSMNTMLSRAVKTAENEDERQRYVYASKELLTIWGSEDKDPSIFDYAWREWGGLIGDFYLMRWRDFFDMLRQSLQYKRPYKGKRVKRVYAREAFRGDEYYSSLADKETAFLTASCKIIKPDTSGIITKSLYNLRKYSGIR